MNVPSIKKIINNPMSLVTLFVVGAMILAACASSTPAANPPATEMPTSAPVATDTPAATATMAPAAMTEPTISVVTDAKLGAILVGDKGMTLYAFTKDTPDTSNCTGNCLKNWPALVTMGKPSLGTGVDASLVGTAKLADGTLIVTYNHMPLYYFYKDTKAGDTNGQGVGSVWFTIGPDGKLVNNAPAATATSAPAAMTEPTISIVNDPNFGQILVGDKGMTLYAFTKDTPDTSTCTGGCLKAWPALVTMGKPNLGPGVDASMIGTAKLADGTLIVTYNHIPLYYFAKDAAAGDTKGQGVGSVWYVVGPDGKLNQKMPAAAATSAPAGKEPTINVVTDPKLGQILVGDNGMTLYVFTKDTADTSNCDSACQALWPLLMTQGKPNLGTGVDASKIGTAKLANGSMVVTYNHMPLYYYANDKKAGDTNGQGIGSVWYAIGPDGNMVTK